MWFWKSSATETPAHQVSEPSKGSANESACPVDHTARAAWLEEARSARGSSRSMVPSDRTHHDLHDLPANHPPLPRLSHEREVSSIPRSVTSSSASNSASYHSQSIPANAEHESSADTKSGNWIYPSEQMFFDAMRRKQHNPQAEDMHSIVPIHNAVNERAWAEIKAWERPYNSSACGGPKLVSFQGSGSSLGTSKPGSTVDSHAPASPGIWEVLSDRNLTPRAKWTVLTGAKPPFDRHDWVVERCKGERIEYVIDFYSGKQTRGGPGISFYLDVRPKLNSLEGWKMRTSRVLGLS